MPNPDPIKQEIKVGYDDKGLKDAARDTKALGEATQKAGDQTEKASRKTRTHEQKLRDMKEELTRLTRVEDRQERQLNETQRAEVRATEASKRRQARIEKLSRALAINKQNQDRATESVKRSSTAVSGNAAAQGQLAGASRLALGGITSMAAGLTGGLGLNALMQELNERIEASNRLLRENAQITRENAEARLDLAALSGVEKPETVAFIDKVAGFAGRRPGEIARTQTQIQSALPTATERDVRGLVVELASAAQTSTSPLPALAPAFLSLFRLTGDPVKSGNLLQGAITAAGEADPARLSQEIEKFVGIGKQIGGLDAGTNVGFAAAGTGLGLPNEIATTGLKNVIFSLRGRGTPEGNKVLDREDIPREVLIEGIKAIQKAVEEGRISNAELEAIGGREAAPVFAALADRETLKRFLDSVQIVIDAGESDTRLSQEKAEGIVGSSPIQSLNLSAKQQESATESIKASDIRAARTEVARATMERVIAQRLKEGMEPFRADDILEEFDRIVALGVFGEDNLTFAAHKASFDSTSLFSKLTGPSFPHEFEDAVEKVLSDGPETDVDSVFGAPQEQGGGTVIDNRTVIHGTQINNGRDPQRSDLGENERPIN